MDDAYDMHVVQLLRLADSVLIFCSLLAKYYAFSYCLTCPLLLVLYHKMLRVKLKSTSSGFI